MFTGKTRNGRVDHQGGKPVTYAVLIHPRNQTLRILGAVGGCRGKRNDADREGHDQPGNESYHCAPPRNSRSTRTSRLLLTSGPAASLSGRPPDAISPREL